MCVWGDTTTGFTPVVNKWLLFKHNSWPGQMSPKVRVFSDQPNLSDCGHFRQTKAGARTLQKSLEYFTFDVGVVPMETAELWQATDLAELFVE